MSGNELRAFISYSHKDADFGAALHKRLEAWTVPKPLRARNFGRARLGRFFRDREELAASPQLTPQIRQALAASPFLIVVCSLNSARSDWVRREIETFNQLRPDGEILAVIADGEPPDCFPSNLPDSAIAADFRAHADGQEDGFLKLVAGLLGARFSEVKDREAAANQSRRRRAGLLTAGFAALSVMSLAGLGAALYFVTKLESMASAAIETSGAISDEAMTMGLNSGASASSVERLLDFSLERLRALEEFGVLNTELSGRIAWTITRRGQLAIMTNDAAKALQAADEALALVPEGNTYASHFSRHAALSLRAQALYLAGDLPAATIDAERAVDAAIAFNGAFPDNYQTELAQSESLGFLAQVCAANEDYERAIDLRVRAIQLLQSLVERFPDSATFPMRLAENFASMGSAGIALGDPARTAPWLRDAFVWQERFLAYNEELQPALLQAAVYARFGAETYLELGDYAEASRLASAAVRYAARVEGADGAEQQAAARATFVRIQGHAPARPMSRATIATEIAEETTASTRTARPTPTAAQESYVAQPRWAVRPNARDFVRYYPVRAMEREQSGDATLDCLILAGGQLECRVQREDPAGWGFGEAALMAARHYTHADEDSAGRPAQGQRVLLTIRFRLG